jgi:hypothetical protein
MAANESGVVEIVKQRYGAIARGEQSGCECAATTDVAKAIRIFRAGSGFCQPGQSRPGLRQSTLSLPFNPE